MGKSKTRFTEAQLLAMGLEQDENGGYRPKSNSGGIKHNFIRGEDDEIKVVPDPNGRWMIRPDLDKVVYTGGVDPVREPNPSPKKLTTLGTEAYHNLVRVLPYDIPAVKELTGKRREETMDSISRDAYEFIKANRLGSIYIPGNVASSKNSKEIFTYKKRNEKGVLEKKYSLSDSKIVVKYRNDRGIHFRENKDLFLRLSEGRSFPLMIEFTFIRDSLRRFDFQNAIQLIADLMSDNGWIPDDDSIHFLPVFNPVVFYCKNRAGVVIKVLN